MEILGFLFGILLVLFFGAAMVGVALGFAIGIARYVRNPMSLLTDINSYFADRRLKRYGR